MPEAEDFKDASSRYMEMPSGKKWFISDPEFDWGDIAYTLANLTRYNGTASRPVSVAEHCVRVSYTILDFVVPDGIPERELALEGLLHDVPEAFIGDVPGPWKSLLPDFVKLENHIYRHLCDHVMETWSMDIPVTHTEACKRADWIELMREAREVMPTQGRDWVMPTPEVMPDIGTPPIYFWTPEEAEQRFLLRLQELTWVR